MLGSWDPHYSTTSILHSSIFLFSSLLPPPSSPVQYPDKRGVTGAIPNF